MKTRLIALALGGIVLLAAAGCYRPAPTAPDAATVANPPGGATPPLADTVLADGSAQVAAITRAVADGFQQAQPADGVGSVAVEVNAAGPSAGFARLCGGEIDLTHAARAMAAGEAEACAANGVEWLEVVIAYDVLAVIANPSDTFLSCLTLDELRAVWGEPGAADWSAVRSWFPERAIVPIAADLEPAQVRFFAQAMGGALRSDAAPGGDDPAFMVAQTPGAVGFLDYGRFPAPEAGAPAAQLVSIDTGAGCAAPTPERVWRGQYGALARPLYLYVNVASLQRPAVAQFVRYYLSADGQARIDAAGYLPAAPETYDAALQAMAGR